jgi:EmrB/QacA subfamily drug resistance transporter
MNDSRRKWWILSVAAAGVLLSTIDASIVNIALPTIGASFNTTVQNTAWATISYLLVITALLLVFGRLSDIYGQKLVFTGGLFVFTIGSALCAISQSITQLVIFRSIQGLGASMIVSNTTAIVTNAFPSQQRGKGLGIIGAVVSVGLMLGPPLGGFIIHYLGWHYIFLINVPIGVAAIIFTWKILPEHKADKGSALFHPLDSVLWIVGVTVLVMAFRVSGQLTSVAGDMLISFGICIVLLGSFYIRQLRSESPLLKPSLFKNEIVLFASIAGFFSYMTMISLSFMFPYLLENTFKMTPLQSGLILVSIPATTAFASPISGHLSDKFGQRPIATLGTIMYIFAIITLFFINADSPTWRLVFSLILFGIGLGMFGSPNNSAIMGSVDIRDRGSAGGIVATVRNLGMVSGLGVISLVYNAGVKSSGGDDILTHLGAFKGALPIIAVLSLVTLIFSALRRSV